VQFDFKRRHGREGGAVAEHAPPQVGIALGGQVDLFAGRGHEADRANRLRGEPVLAREPAMTAPDRVADSTHGARVPGRDGQTVPLGGQQHVEQAGAGSDPGEAGGGIDLDLSERGRVDEECPVRREARTVAGRLNGDRHPVLARKPHGGHDIVRPAPRVPPPPDARFHGEQAL